MSSIINWMGGWPKEGLVSAADWEERVEAVASSVTTEQPGIIERKLEPHGEGKLRNQLAQGLLKEKTGGNSNQIRMTLGADGALSWLLDHALIPGDTLLTERLTSRSALQAFRKAGMKVEAVEGDRRGMNPEALTTAFYRYRPKMVYVSPSCTDPEGVSWSPENKTAIQNRCREAGVLLVTDDRQEMLLYDSDEQRTHKRLEPGHLSIGQLPPGLIAGLRIGWIAGASDLIKSKQIANGIHKELVGSIQQRALSQLIEEQPLEPLLDMLRVQCNERMRKMTEHFARMGIPDVAWVKPRGGLHLWVILPSGLEGEALLRGSWLKGLIFQPGAPFFVKDPLVNTLRITFAFADERQMKQGLARLEESIEEFTGRWSRS
ncbi:aminotransferase class I/II-fold pyridoxal phosphate-dependent enzyme [Cohnella silvisoli]|uniref:PLP-dependent aminotransferase family protein n=1 Tax=Cohnella silvisoli TaxID=2873699 RepID=A0ABV1KV10_9BACL|nr:PLP-dependent aminotransferase family protein [Cohnella silvisoli]MCD9022961.1 PLP-dependent aminotransferase family protein [Cohnella silvisoli]